MRTKTFEESVLSGALAIALALAAPVRAQEIDGIKVHGDWTIVVRNPDGSVAAQHQFKNSLAVSSNADMMLARLLSGELVAGEWSIGFTPGTLCNPNNSPCKIVKAGGAIAGNANNLTAAVATSGPNAKKLVLTGSLRVVNAGNILEVFTTLTTCPGTTTAAACTNVRDDPATSHFLNPSIPVAANQMVDVTVVISFS